MQKKITFYKYQGTGNDFVVLDNRSLSFPKEDLIIQNLCTRQTGVGADGLILLEDDPDVDFRMVYYNADGQESTMCGNGGRCIVAFAHFLNIFEGTCTFSAIDGLHKAELKDKTVYLHMIDVEEVNQNGEDFILNTGSPHYVKFVDEVERINVFQEGKAIRNSEMFKENGINVNFVQILHDGLLKVRTYERGVENETLSCGTGATACALAYAKQFNKNQGQYTIHVPGGQLDISFVAKKNGYTNIWLSGPAQQVFRGEIDLSQFD